MKQLELARHRRNDPDTSKAAAYSVDVPPLEKVVLDYLTKYRLGGATTHEIAEATGIDLVTISPRIRPLVEKGLVEDSGHKRKGRSGRKSIVWKLK